MRRATTPTHTFTFPDSVLVESLGEVWDTVGGVWKLDGVIVNRWHRTA